MSEQALITIATRHQSHYERLKSAEARKFDDFLKQMDRDLRLKLSGLDTQSLSRAKIESQIRQIGVLLNGTYNDYKKVWIESINDASIYEAGFEQRSLSQVVDGVNFRLPSDSQITAAVFNTPLGDIGGASGGSLLETFFTDMKANEIKRIQGAVRFGYVEGQTTQQIIQRIRGTKAAGFNDGLLAISKRNTEAIVRTSLQHAASQARNEVWKRNSKVIARVRWSSTLDSRTSTICRSLDGQEYPIDSGPRPPAHVNACLKGTLIKTEIGLIPIEHVKVGDRVLTHNNRWMPVTIVMAREHDGAAIDLINNLGSCVSFTNEHPILTKSKGWIEAGDIKAGDVFFHNRKDLSWFNRIRESSFIPQAVLIDSHNIKTNVTKELISYGIFSLTAGVSSTIKLNNSISNNKIRVIGEYSILSRIFDVKAVKNRCKDNFVLSWIRNKPFSKRIPLSFNGINIKRRVASLHSFRRVAAYFGVSFWVLSAPMLFTRWMGDKFLIINNRLLSAFSFNVIANAELSNGIIAKSVFSFNKAKAFTVAPMFYINKLFNLLISNHNKTPWIAATCSDTVEYHYSGMVYNLAVSEDETYIAGGIVVHNCRSSTTAVLADKYKEISKGRTRTQRDPETGKIGRTSAETSYYDWLKRQPASVQNSIIGPTRGLLLRNGGISSNRLAELQIGKNFEPLTLDEMRKLDSVAFTTAGL